jgi:cell shape-determining protein MreD
VRFLFVLYLLIIGVLAVLAQMVLPVMFPILGKIGFDAALVPLVVIYASLELGDERAPIVAGLLGVMLDLNLSQHFGTSVIVLFSLSALIVTQANRPETHTLPFRLVFVLVGTFSYLLLTYLFVLVEASRWTWPLAVWSRITFGTLLNLLLAPLFFWLAGILPRLCGWVREPDPQERYYAR